MKRLIYFFLCLLCAVSAAQAQTMTFATYNIRSMSAGIRRMGTVGDNGIPTSLK